MVEDDKDRLKIENVLSVEAAFTTGPENGASDDFGKGLQTRALEKYYPFFDVPLQKLFKATEMKSISIQRVLSATDRSYNIRRKSGQPG